MNKARIQHPGFFMRVSGLSNQIVKEQPVSAQPAVVAGKPIRANFLFRSKDLSNWEYLHPFVEGWFNVVSVKALRHSGVASSGRPA